VHDLAILLVHLLATVARLAGPGGVRAVSSATANGQWQGTCVGLGFVQLRASGCAARKRSRGQRPDVDPVRAPLKLDGPRPSPGQVDGDATVPPGRDAEHVAVLDDGVARSV
jgi:hypothetical protein